MARKFIIDIKTRNISFLQTAKDLKMLGIKNNMFFLRLYDVSLQGVDPHSPNLTDEQCMRIMNEVLVNPWYYLREIARIPDQGNPKGIPYQLNRGNLAATFCFLNGLDHYLVLPRQIGKTQSSIASLTWSFLFGTTSSEFMMINKRQEDANMNLRRLKEQRDLLPKFLQLRLSFDDNGNVKEDQGKDNVKSISNEMNGNSIVTKPSARSVEAAEGIGRGSTQPIQFFDEVEFTPFIKTIIEAAGPAYNTASSNAKRNGAAYCRIFTSTAGDLDTACGMEAVQIIEQTCKWTEQFYDWQICDIEEYITKNSGNGIIYIEYQYQQLGKDEAWFDKTCQTVLNNPLKIKREIFLQRMRGSTESPFAPEDLEAIQDKKGKIIEEIFINKLFKFDIYEAFDRKITYLVGVDVSTGVGNDNSAITILNPYTLKPVADFKSPFIGVTALKNLLYTLVRKHIPRAILCIERNHNGEAILDGLRYTDISGNIYFDNSKDFLGDTLDDKLDAQGMLKLEAARRKLYGVYTQKTSRSRMMSLLESHVEEHKDKFVTDNIIGDLLRLIRSKRGKIEAGAGFHDDSIMSYLIALYVYYYGNNLHRFGFVKGALPGEEESNKGLDYEDNEDDLPEDYKDMVQQIGRDISGLDNKFMEEIKRAREEMKYIDQLTKPINMVEDYNDSGDSFYDNIPSELFFDLND